jgi:TetR/AcrR family transcriptional regulator, cholesterol catabolism regulator
MPRNRLSADDRRTQIIEKAAEVFSVKGVIGTRTRDVADACGINEALIYRYFESKEELYREAMLHAYSKVVDLWKPRATEYSDGLTALLAVMEDQFRIFTQNPMLCANMWHGIATTIYDPVMREDCQVEFERYHSLLRSLIKRGIDDGSIRPDFDPCFGLWLIRGVGLSFIMRGIIDMQVPEEVGNPVKYCEFLRRILAPVKESGSPVDVSKNP